MPYRMAIVASTALWLVASSALARDPAAAEAMFQAAKHSLERGEIDDACEKFRESHQLDPAVGTLYNLADCEQQRGRTATAWALFVEVGERLEPADERKATVAERIATLAPRLAHLTVRLAPGAPSRSRVRRGDTAVGAASIGVSVAIDPGAHELVVEADGHEPKRFTVEVAEAASIEIVVGPGRPLPKPPPTTVHADPPVESSISLHPIGLTLIGVGVVGVGVGIGVGFAAEGQYADAEASCPGNVCDQAAFDQRNDAITTSHIGTGIFFAGLGLAVVGGILEIVELTGGDDAHADAQILPWALPHSEGWSAGLGGRF